MSVERQESKLVRNLSFWDLMGIAVGQIIGAGIMSSTGIAIGMTGTGVVLAFLVSPVLTILTIYPVAILGASIPATGGPYRYVSRLLGKPAGMLYLLLHTSSNMIIASLSLSFASYFVSIVPGISEHLVAMILLTVFYIINMIGTKSAAIANKIISAALVGGLFLFIAFGLGKTDFGYIVNPQNLFAKGPFAFISTLALLGGATGGAQYIAELGGEAKDAGKNIPKVIVISTFAVGVFYVLIAAVASGVLPIEQVADQPLTLVAKATMPVFAFYLFVIGAALGATSSTLNSTLSCVTKPLLVACDDGMLPRSLGSVSKRGVPFKILTLFYICGMIPLMMKLDLAFIVKFTMANFLLNKIFVCVALYVLTVKKREILENSTMKITIPRARFYAVIGIVILIILSSSMLLNLTLTTVLFLAGAMVLTVLYTYVCIKDVVIPDDLGVDYTSTKSDKE